MATDNNKVGTVSNLDSSLTSLPKPAAKKSADQVNQTDFMTLLVTQLKNQDPLNPMDSQQFAVQLAQFSQLEQLTQINQKLGSDQTSTASLATYLNHEITYAGSSTQVASGDGGAIKLDLAQAASNVQVALTDASGSVKQLLNLGAMTAGKHSVPLRDLTVPNGQYGIQVNGVGTDGISFQPNFSVAGVVSGFVPGADPKLLVGSTEVSPSDVLEVGLPS
jgi:flagellar basal-body rod modification protein FlgD